MRIFYDWVFKKFFDKNTNFDGTIVFIRKCDDIPFGKIVVFMLNGCVYLKRLCEKGGEMMLKSDNNYYRWYRNKSFR
ncbi:LexA family protein [Fusobacterium varium]|uniref:LexA family protein n=1 Tax=Fusobacterium varium TaxID=856 RepID=UPI002A0ED87D|nr:S24 family peptidase [Fusobacterium varium]